MIVDSAAYVEGHRNEVEPTAEALAAWRQRDDGFVWVGLRTPSADELHAICTALDLDDIPVSAVLAPHTRPVLEIEGTTVQMVLRTARYN